MNPIRSAVAVMLLAAFLTPTLQAAPAATAALKAPAAVPGLATGTTPFWTGTPNVAEFTRRENLRLTRAKAAIARMLAVKGPRTIENTLRPFDDANLELDAMLSQSSLLENVHPDSAMRAAAEKATQEGASYGTEISLDRKVWEALKGLSAPANDAETAYYLERTMLGFHLSGVDKDDATRARIKTLNDELVKTSQDFARNIRSDQPKVMATAAELEGVPADFIAAHTPDASGKLTLQANESEYFPVET